MEILIVDNGSFYLDKLVSLLPSCTIQIVSYPNLKTVNAKKFDGVILSGGHSLSIVGHDEAYSGELKLIKSIAVPLLGICLGCELIAFAYDTQLTRLEKEERGVLSVEMIKKDHIFHNIHDLKVYEAHRWAIKQTPTELIPLALSQDGVEVFKHKTKCLYGVQFHPEAFVEETTASQILTNFFHFL